MSPRQLDGLVDHSYRALGGGSDDDFCAQKPHQPAPLDAERLRHGDHQRISLGGANHGKADSGVSAGRLDHGLAGLELSGFFRRLDDAERQPVLHRTERVEGFDFSEKIHIPGCQAVDSHHRRVAHRFKNALIFPCHYK